MQNVPSVLMDTTHRKIFPTPSSPHLSGHNNAYYFSQFEPQNLCFSFRVPSKPLDAQSNLDA